MLLGSQVIPLANNSRSGGDQDSGLGLLESWYDEVHIPLVLTLSPGVTSPLINSAAWSPCYGRHA